MAPIGAVPPKRTTALVQDSAVSILCDFDSAMKDLLESFGADCSISLRHGMMGMKALISHKSRNKVQKLNDAYKIARHASRSYCNQVLTDVRAQLEQEVQQPHAQLPHSHHPQVPLSSSETVIPAPPQLHTCGAAVSVGENLLEDLLDRTPIAQDTAPSPQSPQNGIMAICPSFAPSPLAASSLEPSAPFDFQGQVIALQVLRAQVEKHSLLLARLISASHSSATFVPPSGDNESAVSRDSLPLMEPTKMPTYDAEFDTDSDEVHTPVPPLPCSPVDSRVHDLSNPYSDLIYHGAPVGVRNRRFCAKRARLHIDASTRSPGPASLMDMRLSQAIQEHTTSHILSLASVKPSGLSESKIGECWRFGCNRGDYVDFSVRDAIKELLENDLAQAETTTSSRRPSS